MMRTATTTSPLQQQQQWPARLNGGVPALRTAHGRPCRLNSAAPAAGCVRGGGEAAREAERRTHLTQTPEFGPPRARPAGARPGRSRRSCCGGWAACWAAPAGMWPPRWLRPWTRPPQPWPLPTPPRAGPGASSRLVGAGRRAGAHAGWAAKAKATHMHVRTLPAGVPAERAAGERRVALTPASVQSLLKAGFGGAVVERGAGGGARLADNEYESAGARLADREAALGADVVVKVSSPARSLVCSPRDWGAQHAPALAHAHNVLEKGAEATHRCPRGRACRRCGRPRWMRWQPWRRAWCWSPTSRCVRAQRLARLQRSRAYGRSSALPTTTAGDLGAACAL